MKGSTRLWLGVMCLAVIAIVVYVIIPNWGNEFVVVPTIFFIALYVIIDLSWSIVSVQDGGFNYTPIGMLFKYTILSVKT